MYSHTQTFTIVYTIWKVVGKKKEGGRERKREIQPMYLSIHYLPLNHINSKIQNLKKLFLVGESSDEHVI